MKNGWRELDIIFHVNGHGYKSELGIIYIYLCLSKHKNILFMFVSTDMKIFCIYNCLNKQKFLKSLRIKKIEILIYFSKSTFCILSAFYDQSWRWDNPSFYCIQHCWRCQQMPIEIGYWMNVENKPRNVLLTWLIISP